MIRWLKGKNQDVHKGPYTVLREQIYVMDKTQDFIYRPLD